MRESNLQDQIAAAAAYENLRRLGETEYALIDPRHAREIQYGTLYLHPDFPDRYDANQLCRVKCRPSQASAMLAELDRELDDTDLNFRKVSGYDPAVWSHLGPTLKEAGWETHATSLMLLRRSPTRDANPSLQVRSVSASSADLEGLYRTDGKLDRGFELARSQFSRVGGEYLVGYLDSEPACCTGWYVVGGMVRFRHVFTASWARGRGCATTLILHVQDHPAVRVHDGLVIMVNPDGPEGLYRDLGFDAVATFWEAKVSLPGANWPS